MKIKHFICSHGPLFVSDHSLQSVFEKLGSLCRWISLKRSYNSLHDPLSWHNTVFAILQLHFLLLHGLFLAWLGFKVSITHTLQIYCVRLHLAWTLLTFCIKIFSHCCRMKGRIPSLKYFNETCLYTQNSL